MSQTNSKVPITDEDDTTKENSCNSSFSLTASSPQEQFEFGIKVIEDAFQAKVSQLHNQIKKLEDSLADRNMIINELEKKNYYLEKENHEYKQRNSRMIEDNRVLAQNLTQMRNQNLELDRIKNSILSTITGSQYQSNVTSPIVSPRQANADDIAFLCKSYENPLRLSSEIAPMSPKVQLPLSPADQNVNSNTDSREILVHDYETAHCYNENDSISSKEKWENVPTKLNLGKINEDQNSSKESKNHFKIDENSHHHYSSHHKKSKKKDSKKETRMESKEFFREVRQRLKNDAFNHFLISIKRLNNNSQTKEQTLKEAENIFGSPNKDLFSNFKYILSPHIK